MRHREIGEGSVNSVELHHSIEIHNIKVTIIIM